MTRSAEAMNAFLDELEERLQVVERSKARLDELTRAYRPLIDIVEYDRIRTAVDNLADQVDNIGGRLEQLGVVDHRLNCGLTETAEALNVLLDRLAGPHQDKEIRRAARDAVDVRDEFMRQHSTNKEGADR